MKRITALILLAAFILCAFAACGPKDGEAPAAQTTQTADEPAATEAAASSVPDETPASRAEEKFYVFDLSPDKRNSYFGDIFETDDAYYYMCDQAGGAGEGGNTQCMIWFSDKEYRDWMPLCFKPDCRHRDGKCNALCEGPTKHSFTIYGRYIYYLITVMTEELDEVQLWRMKLDGSEHELVQTPELEHDVDFTGADSVSWYINFYFAGKYAFINYSVTAFAGEHEELSKANEQFIIDLDRPEENPTKPVFTDENGEPVPIYNIKWSDGEKLYGIRADIESDRETQTMTQSFAGLYRYDLSTMKAGLVCEFDFDWANWVSSDRRITLYDGKAYLVSGSDDVYCVDIETGEQQKVFETPEGGLPLNIPAGEYIVGDTSSYSYKYFDFAKTNDPATWIYTIDGELVQTIPYDTYAVDLVPYYRLGDIIFAFESCDPYEHNARIESALQFKPPVWYLDLGELGSEGMTWHKWEP